MELHLLKVFVLVILAICASNTNALPSAQRTAIDKGLEAGTVLAETLTNGNFRKSLTKLGKNLAPFLGALGPLAGIFLAFLPGGDSAELAYMKKKFTEVNNKLDIITSEFKEVKNAIDWSTVVVSYGAYERKIRAAEANLNRIYEVKGQARKHEQQNFINQYESDFDNSLLKLYDAIMKNDHVFSKNILDAAVKKTKNYKRKVEQFSLGLVQLLVQAIKVKVSYYGMKKWAADHVIEHWTSNMNKLKGKLLRLSDEVKGRYLTQLKTDTNDLITRYHALGNKGLMRKIYYFVRAKYDWRYWFVAVYNDMRTVDRHTIWKCGGDAFLHKKNKNIIISSQDKVHSSKFKKYKATRVLQSISNDINKCRLRNPGSRAKALVNYAKSKVGGSCVPYALRMAVKTGSDMYFISWNRHRAYRHIKKTKRCCWKNTGWWGGSICKRVYWDFNMVLFG